MINSNLKKITVSIASIPSREKSLNFTVNSILNQIDVLNIYLNGYDYIPLFLKNKKINIMRSQDYKNLGDIGKFYWSDTVKGYHFTCDDDIIYHPNYINTMIKNINKYNGFISCHGAIFKTPFQSFYKSKKTFHFRKKVDKDYFVNLVGTGVLGYDADKIKLPFKIFKNKNMADVYVAIYAKTNNIPCVVIKHKKNFHRRN